MCACSLQLLQVTSYWRWHPAAISSYFSRIHNRSNYSDGIWHRSLYYCHKRVCIWPTLQLSWESTYSIWRPAAILDSKNQVSLYCCVAKGWLSTWRCWKAAIHALDKSWKKWMLNWCWWWWWYVTILTHHLNWNVIWLNISLYLAYT